VYYCIIIMLRSV